MATGRVHQARGLFPKTETLLVCLVGVGLAGLFFNPYASVLHMIPRLALAAVITISLFLISLRNPRAAVLLCMGFLALVGLVRRLLIPAAGWSSYDALLLVGPVFSMFLWLRLFALEKKRLAKEFLSFLVLALLILSLLESLNPSGGSLISGVVGLLFLAAPLMWFFVGRELGGMRLSNLLSLVLVLGTVSAMYGLWQSLVGLPDWDASWVQLNGYTALNVAGQTRAFGTFASSAEYAAYVGAALVIGLAAVMRGRFVVLPILPVLGFALFLESSRGAFILALVALIVILGLRTGRLSVTVATVTTAAILTTGSILLFGTELSKAGTDSGNPFIAHQVSGLTNPLDPNRSTLLAHLQLIGNGLTSALNHPLGLGTAVTNLAAQDSSRAANTEVDISNAFVSLGLVGGFLFVSIVLVAFRRVGELALRAQHPDVLAVTGILIVTAGQWLNGGYYAISPLVWFLIGACMRRWLDRPEPELDGRSRQSISSAR